MSLSTVTKVAYNFLKNKESRQTLKKFFAAIFIIFGVVLAAIFSIANAISNANRDIISRIFAGQAIEDISFDASPAEIKELINQLEGIQEGFSSVDKCIEYYNENFIVGDKIDSNWVKAVYFSVFIEHKIDRSADWAFVSCFIQSVPNEGFKYKIKPDKNIVYEDLSEMLGWNITDTAKQNAEAIYSYLCDNN